jgi:hypothetical protein
MGFDEGVDVFGVFEDGFEGLGEFLEDSLVLVGVPEGDKVMVNVLR